MAAAASVVEQTTFPMSSPPGERFLYQLLDHLFSILHHKQIQKEGLESPLFVDPVEGECEVLEVCKTGPTIAGDGKMVEVPKLSFENGLDPLFEVGNQDSRDLLTIRDGKLGSEVADQLGKLRVLNQRYERPA
jgi:hypothetical protein